jgi:protease IV
MDSVPREDPMAQQDGCLKRLLVLMLSMIGAIALLILIIGLGAYVYRGLVKDRLPAEVVLEFDLEEGVIEHVPDDPIGFFASADLPTVRDIVDALEKAKGDDRVRALVARLGTGDMGLAQIEEIRDAVISFRESGKPAIAFAETFGEVSPGLGHYYLSTAFDSVYLQPSGDLNMIGLISENPFLKNLLDGLRVKVQLEHRYEYKTAKNRFTEEEFTEPHRESTEHLVDSIFDRIVRTIGSARGYSPDEVRQLVDEGPYTAPEALDRGLVDGLAYRDQVFDGLKEQVGKDARFLFLRKYLERVGRPHSRGETIALIYGVGTVSRGEGGFDPISLDSSMGSETITRAFREATEDDDVKAIIFRIDSPGGSYVASDTIRREILRARERGKPVIATMGNVAASGGYLVAVPANKIVAQPSTLTGSIGVLGGKFVVRDLSERLGVTWDSLETSRSSSIWSYLQEFTPAQSERVDVWLDRVYEEFVLKTAAGRSRTPEEIHEVAKGRVWTGEDALARGLVDEIGGFGTAIRLAREEAGIAPEKEILIRLFPPETTWVDMIFDRKPDSSHPTSLALYVKWMKALKPLIEVARRAGLHPGGDALKMNEIHLKH